MCPKKPKMPAPAAPAVDPPTQTISADKEVAEGSVRKVKGKRKLTIPTAGNVGTGVNM